MRAPSRRCRATSSNRGWAGDTTRRTSCAPCGGANRWCPPPAGAPPTSPARARRSPASRSWISATSGRAIAKALAAEGVRLAVVARRRELLEALQAEIGAKLVIIECDFMREDAPQAIAAAALAGLATVDIIVNNAGGSRKFKLETDEAQREEAMTPKFTRQRQLPPKMIHQLKRR